MISFLGTGLLGANFTRALLQKGEKVQIWNRTAEKTKLLEQEGAKAFARAADAVKGADRIHLTLSDDAVVDEVLAAAAEGFSPGVIIIDHSTTSVPGASERSARWKEKGFYYVHAPVFMGPINALQGTGIMLISGDQELVGKLTPALSGMTGKLWNLGDQPEKAAAIKLLGNLFHICLTGGVSDLITLAGSLDVPSSELKELLDVLNPSVVAQGRLKKITSNTFNEASWELAMARKDARLMTEQAERTRKTLTVIPAVAKKMDIWLNKGFSRHDWTILSQDPDEA